MVPVNPAHKTQGKVEKGRHESFQEQKFSSSLLQDDHLFCLCMRLDLNEILPYKAFCIGISTLRYISHGIPNNIFGFKTAFLHGY